MPERFRSHAGKTGKMASMRYYTCALPEEMKVNGSRIFQAGQIDHPCAPPRQQDYNFHMHRLRTTRTLYGWTVLLAFLFGLFVPAISHAVAQATQQPAAAWITEICSASGTRHVMVLADDGPQHSVPAVPDMSHCDLCCPQHHASLAPPPHLTALPALGRQRDAYPPLFYHAPSPQFAWSPTQSRGPPSSLS